MIFQIIRTGIFELRICRLNIFNGYRRQPGKVWHIAPKCGLMNDPNGLCEINGIHHIFYQWFPAGPVHGLKHWYHLTTKDFIYYEDHGVAMYPDTESDSYGCYTGMALKEGEKVHVFYTGIENEEMIPCTCYARFD